MLFSLAADIVLIIHLGFIVFVILGGFLLLRWRWLIFIHLPAVVWAALLEFQGWLCPLTPLEQMLRRLAGQQGYEASFIQHYLLPVIYPSALEEDIQFMLGVLVIVINVIIYLVLFMKLGMKGKSANRQNSS